MSILYSAGSLHQNPQHKLPSWVPDWTYTWYQAPLWCKTKSNIAVCSGKDEWSAGIRCEYRTGGDRLQTFEVIDGMRGMHQLLLSALLVDIISDIGQTASSLPAALPVEGNTPRKILPSQKLSYGRSFFRTEKGTIGVATQGMRTGDVIAILPGGDVPVLLRSAGIHQADKPDIYELLCECFVESCNVMNGELMEADRMLIKDILLM